MTLRKYSSKRNLKKSGEPKGGKGDASALHFVIQKHAASHLHYDVRLEHHGVLLSWAVPKEPSLNPQDKRLAIHVEDHPLDYQYFEGEIPKGNYGAGTVKIWDHGFYTCDKSVTEGLKMGHLLVTLHGERLNGEFVFQKLKKDPDDKNWLFFKKGVSEKHVMPQTITPMLATLIDKPFSDENWLFEIKWDGFRTLAFIDNGTVTLKSRSNHLLKFPSLVKQLEKMSGQLILDGEAVVLDAKGKPSFQLIQNYAKGEISYYVFDLLYKDGEDLRDRPLIERKELLKAVLQDSSHVHLSDHIIKDGEGLFKEASKLGLEGIIGKKLSSSYQSRRSRDWVKIKTIKRQEVVIAGFTEPRGSRKLLGAVIVAVYDEKGELRYAGHVGGGFDAALLKAVYQKLKPLIRKKSPFKTVPKTNTPVTWVKPQLVCEVTFSEWTQGGEMRQPIFQGLRTDKPAKEVREEMAETREKFSTTNEEKIYWPKEKYTKGDLIAYYRSVAPFILPYLKGRPIMLHRYPEGITKPGFYQKDLEQHPSWIKTFPIEQEGRIIHYLLIEDAESLLYAVNLGSIDLHPFLASTKRLLNPDFCVIDLDPHGVPFSQLVEIASAMHEFLEQLKVVHLCKTSGGNGLHFYIPLKGKYDFDQSQQFATLIAQQIHEQFPKNTSLERSPKKRLKKIYLDCLQNHKGQTVVAPYAVRPRPNAQVSTPLEWEELDSKLDPALFTIQTVPERLKKRGDLFKRVLGAGINMKAILSKIQ